MELLVPIAWFVSLLMVIGFFKMWYLLGCIKEGTNLVNQKLAFQTGLLERCARSLETLAGKSPPPPPADRVAGLGGDRIADAADKGLSLGGYNR